MYTHAYKFRLNWPYFTVISKSIYPTFDLDNKVTRKQFTNDYITFYFFVYDDIVYM